MNKTTKLIFRLMAFLIIITLVIPSPLISAEAAVATLPPPQMPIDKTELTMLVGDKETVSVDIEACREFIPEDWRFDYSYISYDSSDSTVIRVDRTGTITAVGPGEADAKVSFNGVWAPCHCTVLPNYLYISSEDVTVCYGDSFNISLDTDLNIRKYSYKVYPADSWLPATGAILSGGTTGPDYTFTANDFGDYRIVISCKADDGTTYSRRCDVHVVEQAPVTDDVVVAVGGTVRIPLIRSRANSVTATNPVVALAQTETAYAAEFAGSEDSSSDPGSQLITEEDDGSEQEDGTNSQTDGSAPQITSGSTDPNAYTYPVNTAHDICLATADDYIRVTGQEAGDTVLYINYTPETGYSSTTKVRVHVTDPVFTPFDGYVEAGTVYEVPFEDLDEDSIVSSVRLIPVGGIYGAAEGFLTLAKAVDEEGRAYATGRINPSRDERDSITSFVTSGYGNYIIRFTVDGRTEQQYVTLVDPELTYDSILVSKGSTHPLGVTGIPDNLWVSYISDNTNYVRVNSEGIVTGRKNGRSCIYVNINGIWELKCGVSIGNTKAIKATFAAEEVLGALYSQPRRMKEGYYDCSSLVFRVFRDTGNTIASAYSTYAPTAAEIARLQEKSKWVISYEYLPADELQPGDLIFYQNTMPNNRYRNIGHVAIYYGPAYDKQFGGEINTGKILHAFNEVEFGDYSNFRTERIVMISRPFGS